MGKSLTLKLFLAMMLVLFTNVGTLPSAQAATYSRYTVDRFLENHAELICKLAHPTAEYYSSYLLGNQEMEIRYRSAWTGDLLSMRVRVKLNSKGSFEGLHVISDDAFVPPFAATTAIKNIAMYLLKNEDESHHSDDKSQVLRYIREHLYNMSGKQMAELILLYQWM